MTKIHTKNLQAIKRLDSLHAIEDFGTLDSSELHFMVMMAIQRDLLTDSLKRELIKRLRNSQIRSIHLSELILKFSEQEEWSKIKELAIKNILTRDTGIKALLNLGRTLRDWPAVEYEIVSVEKYGKDLVYAAARLKFPDSEWYSKYYTSESTARSKHLAASEMVIRLLGQTPKSLMVNLGVTTSELRSHLLGSSVENWKSKLHEYCAQKKIPFPAYSIYQVHFIHQNDHNSPDEYEAIATIGEGANGYSSFPHRGLTRKEAEQRASQSLLTIISKYLSRRGGKKVKTEIEKIFPVNSIGWHKYKNHPPTSNIESLRLYCQSYRHSPPKYFVHRENVESRERLMVTVIVTTDKNVTMSHYGLCSLQNRRNKVNKVKQFVALKLLKKLQSIHKPETVYWYDL